MPATFAELLTPVTETEAEEVILALLEAVGFPATAWQKFSIPRTTVKLLSRLYADSRTGITNAVKSRLLRYATGDALDYLSEQLYENERDKAVPTEGNFVLADAGGAPYTIVVGQLLVRDTATGLLYRNTEGGTLAAEDSLTLKFRADKPGAAYNISADSALEFAQTLEGVDITNPPDPSTGTWITLTGTDAQSDESLSEEDGAKWATLGAGNEDAYKAWALAAHTSITKVTVLASGGDGIVKVYIATDAGAPDSSIVDIVNAYVQARRPLGLRLCEVIPAGPLIVTVTATVHVTADESLYMGRLAAAVTEFNRALQIGEPIYLTRIVAMLHSPGHVRNVEASMNAPDGAGDADEIVVVQLGTITIVKEA